MAGGDEDQSELSITNRDELKSFLEGRSRSDAVVMALRLVWRVWAYLGRELNDDKFSKLTLATSRAIICAQLGDANAARAAARSADCTDSSAYPVVTAAAMAAAVSFSGDSLFNIGEVFAYSNSLGRQLNLSEQVQLDAEYLQKTGDELISQPLWRDRMPTPDWSISLAEMQLRLRDLGHNWTLLSHWYEQVRRDASVDPFIDEALVGIAKETGWFWGDDDETRTPNIVIADISERLGWSPDQVLVEGERKLEQQSSNNYPGSAKFKTTIEKKIKEDPHSVAQLVDGLMKMVAAEIYKVSDELPNHPERQEEQQSQLRFLEKLHSGLQDIEKSLALEKPKETEAKIHGLIQRLSNWYDEQPEWAQKSVKATGILTVAAPFALTGFPAWLAVAVPAALLAKDEIGDLKEMLGRDGD